MDASITPRWTQVGLFDAGRSPLLSAYGHRLQAHHVGAMQSIPANEVGRRSPRCRSRRTGVLVPLALPLSRCHPRTRHRRLRPSLRLRHLPLHRFNDGQTCLSPSAHRRLSMARVAIRSAPGMRRVRDYGFLHGNAKHRLRQVQLVLRVIIQARTSTVFDSVRMCCPRCRQPMHAVFIIARQRPSGYAVTVADR
jgi:hypothetical protein